MRICDNPQGKIYEGSGDCPICQEYDIPPQCLPILAEFLRGKGYTVIAPPD